MTGDGAPLSAFAARKRLLARASEPKSPSTTEDETAGDAGAGAPKGAGGPGDAASDGVRSKRVSRRRKRQRVETAPGQAQAVTSKSGSTQKTDSEDGRRSAPQLEVAREPSQSPAEPPTAASGAKMDVAEDIGASEPLASVLKESGAVPETPARRQSVPTTPDKVPPFVSLSSFIAKDVIQDSITLKGKGVIELRVDQGDRLRLPIVGQYGVRVIRGEASVAGATLRPSSEITWIRSSLCYSSPVPRCPDGSVLELHQHPNSDGLRNLGCLSPLFRGIWNSLGPRNDFGTPSYQILCGPEDLPKKSVFRPLYSPPEWNKKLSELTDTAEPAPVFVCGPKGSGKSTFSRLLTNRFLTRAQQPQKGKSRASQNAVVVLDIDPGQPEFCPAGTISLVVVRKPNLSPTFAHPWPDDASTTLIRCHALASVSPGSDPDMYMECALDLYSRYQRSWNGYPLIVNTPGWILGTGLDLLGLVIERIRPREVVYMSEDGPAETVDDLQAACGRASSFSTLPSQQSDSGARKTAAQLRAMQTMSYFHTQGTTNTGHLSWNPSPLSTIPPWRVKYSGRNRGFAGIMCYGDQPNPALLAEAINGMVLAAVEIEDERAFRRREPEDTPMDIDVSERAMLDSLDSLIRRTPEGIPYFDQSEGETLDPAYTRTIGLVLVRGVDTDSAALQILTPIPRSTLQEIRQNGRHVVFVHGQFDAPTWAYTEDLYEREFKAGDEESESDEEGAAAGVNRPWVEGVDEGRRRQAGMGAWRVRRDLGKQR